MPSNCPFIQFSPAPPLENGLALDVSIGSLFSADTADVYEDQSQHNAFSNIIYRSLSCDFISQVKSLKVADIIRGGLRRFTDSLGQLWCSLADYFIRSGHFEKARDVYEEAIQTVMTVRDFGQVSVI